MAPSIRIYRKTHEGQIHIGLQLPLKGVPLELGPQRQTPVQACGCGGCGLLGSQAIYFDKFPGHRNPANQIWPFSALRALGPLSLPLAPSDYVYYVYIYTDKTSLKADREEWGGRGKPGRTQEGCTHKKKHIQHLTNDLTNYPPNKLFFTGSFYDLAELATPRVS